MKIIIHTNMGLANQRESAEWMRQGFDSHNVNCEVTAHRHKEADIHVVMGPHYARDIWYGKPNVIWLDRSFWGSSRYDLSIGWLNADGSRDFRNKNMPGPNGKLPELKPKKTASTSAMVFCDYGQDPRNLVGWAKTRYNHVAYRRHPADEKPDRPLSSVWRDYDAAIGHSSTVLVQAVIQGLHVISFDPRHVVQDIYDRHAKNNWNNAERDTWLQDMSWAQWNYKQIINGDWISHLCIQ